MSSSVARGVKQVVTTVRQLEGAGFVVRRALGGAKLNYLDPFLMLGKSLGLHWSLGPA